MNKLQHILFLLFLSFHLPVVAQTDSIAVLDTLIYENSVLDSILAASDASGLSSGLNYSDTSENSILCFFDEAMAWLDTTDCTSTGIITDLPDSVYKARLQALPFIIEVPYHPVVRECINRYIKGSGRQLARLCRLSDYYFPMFQDMLERYELPYELCYLAVIESALNPAAHSRMGAAGLWQFMPSTGRLYGLEINTLVDERRDPIRSTEAACRYLKNLYSLYGDWNLAIASYNCGPGNVNKAIRRAGGKRDFWSIYPYLPKETRSYLPIFIAASYAMNYADQHGICPDPDLQPIVTDTLYTSQRLHLQQVSDILKIDLADLRRLNPQYPKDVLPGGKPYTICLPIEKIELFIANEDTIIAHKADELINNRRTEIDIAHRTKNNGTYKANGVTYYKVRQGDTLGAIARRHHCTVRQLQRWNNLSGTNIRAGKTLRIGG
ncbi:MAG: transglycosylase SLT domain-containing protein [Paludibacteraceae bacterium]|nr:transglycosylase SLT domain-containing protein [Paludibacteraceae bacterium]